MTAPDELPDGTGVPRWRTRGVEVRYENPWIRVTHREVVAPTGAPGIYGVVHFRHRAVGVVALDDARRVWLVGQWRYTLDAWSWEIPEGGATGGEAPVEAARRELAEECGLAAASWTPLVEVHTSNSVTDELGRVWLARGLSSVPSAPDETERLVVRRVALDEAVAMALDGRITDSLSVAALLKLGLLDARGELGRADEVPEGAPVDGVPAHGARR